MGRNQCFVCGQRVLGLIGQDALLDTYNLHKEDADKRAIAAKAYGSCHLRCLIASGWGPFWARRLRDNFQFVRNFAVIAAVDNVVVLHNPVMQELTVIGDDGWVAFATIAALRGAQEMTDGWAIPTRHELRIDLPDHSVLARSIQQALGEGRPFALQTVIDDLGLATHLLYPAVVKDGSLEAVQSWPENNARLWREDLQVIIAEAQYGVFMPHSMFSAICASKIIYRNL